MRSDDSSSSSSWPASGIGGSSAEAVDTAPNHPYATLLGAIDQAYLFGELIRDERQQPCDFLVLEVNPSFESLTGISQQEALGASATDLFPCDLVQWFLAAFARVISSRERFRLESRNPIGGRFYRLYAIPDQSDRFAALFSASAHHRLPETASDRVPNLLWSTDPQGALDWCNQRWIDYTGHRPEQAIGSAWHGAIHPDELTLFRVWLADGLAGGKTFSRSFAAVTETGTTAGCKCPWRPIAIRSPARSCAGMVPVPMCTKPVPA